MKKDLDSLIGTPVKSLDNIARTASANGATADLKGYRSCMIIFDVDAYTDGTVTPSVQHSDDNSTWSATAASDLVGTLAAITGANDDQVHKVGYVGEKRYVRGVVTIAAGATSGAIIGSIVFPGHKINNGKLNA